MVPVAAHPNHTRKANLAAAVGCWLRKKEMPDQKFTKPWHGVPRESIDWHPTVNDKACIGCGTCSRKGFPLNISSSTPTAYKASHHGYSEVIQQEREPSR